MWRAAAAGAISLAVLASGAGMAYAAPGDILNPQSNGSKGSYYLYDQNFVRADTDPSTVFHRDTTLTGSGSATDFLADINPAPAYAVTGGQAPWSPTNMSGFTGVWRFISDKTPAAVAGGTATWKAYAVDSATGPNGGTQMPDLTLNALGPQVDAVIGAGGSYWYGIGYTINSGVKTVGAVYREINITAGSGDFTVGPVEVETGPAAPTVTTQPADAAIDLGATATFTAASSDAAATVKWQSSSDNGSTWADVAGATSTTLTVANVTVAQNNTMYHAIFTNASGSVTTNAATLTVTGPVQPGASDPNNVTVADPAVGTSTITVPAGAANANKTFTAWGWSTRTNLGQVTTDASGNATVDVSALGLGSHTVALADSNFAIVAWGTFSITSQTTSSTTVSATVTTSNKFALEGVATAADLGQVKRGATSTPVPLGVFTVTDDRATLPGWNLNTAVADFVNASANNDVIGKAALGLAPVQVGTALPGISLGTAQVAGAGVYGSVFASGAVNSSTLDAGTQFNADLSFAAPASAKAGTYTSTLTLDLVSK